MVASASTIMPQARKTNLSYSPFQVIQLMRTMDQMLAKAGVDDVDNEVKGPTQIHNLLEIIKKEQQIYDVVFHEAS